MTNSARANSSPPHYIARERKKSTPSFGVRSSASRPTGITTTPFFLRCIAKSRLRLRSDAFRTDGRIKIASMRQFAKKLHRESPSVSSFSRQRYRFISLSFAKGEKCVAAELHPPLMAVVTGCERGTLFDQEERVF